MQKELIFIFSIFFCLFVYRSIVSTLIISKKKVIIDEQSYLLFGYLSLTCLVTFFSKNISVGIIMLALTPIVLIVYFLVIKKRIYWIVNGVNTNLASYGNALIDKIDKFKDLNYMKEHVILRKVDGKIQVSIENLTYEEKEHVINVLKKTAKSYTKEVTGRQYIYFAINIFIALIFFFLLLLFI